MISILVTLLLFIIAFGLVYWIVTLIPLPQPFKSVALVVLLVIALICVLGMFGLYPGGHWIVRVP